MTGRPAALSAFALASTARVADSEMADTRADILVVGMHPWCHLSRGAHQPVSPQAELPATPPATKFLRGAHRGAGGASPREILRKFGADTVAVFAIGPELVRLVRRRGLVRHTLWGLQP